MSRFFHTFEHSGLFQAAKEEVRLLKEAGFQAYFAGGAVRDLLLGRTPGDIDIATSATPDQIHAVFPETHDSGAAFGVVTVHLNGFLFETATFRKECSYSDGRHPGQTIYTDSPEEDVARRDFTINGMMLDPFSGEILDFVGGRADLRAGIIRTIGNAEQRFTEDALRILRGVRFLARYDFPFAPETEQAAMQLAGNLRLLSAERIHAELEEMLTGPRPAHAFRTLERIGALKIILPEIQAMKGVEQPPQFHPEGDVFEHTMVMLKHLAHPTKELAWSVLLHDAGKPLTAAIGNDGQTHFYGHEAVGARMAESILQRLKCSSELTGIVRQSVADHMRFTMAAKMRRSTLMRQLAKKSFPTTLELLRIDCISCHGKLNDYLFLLDTLHELSGKPPVPPPLLTGKDLLALGMPSGPAMGALLKHIWDMQLEGQLKDRESALAEARQKLYEKNL